MTVATVHLHKYIHRVTCVSARYCICIRARTMPRQHAGIRLSRIHAGRRVPQEVHKPIIPACRYMQYVPLRCIATRYANKCARATTHTCVYVSYI